VSSIRPEEIAFKWSGLVPETQDLWIVRAITKGKLHWQYYAEVLPEAANDTAAAMSSQLEGWIYGRKGRERDSRLTKYCLNGSFAELARL